MQRPDATYALRPPAPSRTIATLSIEAAPCQEATRTFEIAVPNYTNLDLNNPGPSPGFEWQPVSTSGGATIRNLHFDRQTGKLTGELYARGTGAPSGASGCNAGNTTAATFQIRAFYKTIPIVKPKTAPSTQRP
jgi:hypothetical protein